MFSSHVPCKRFKIIRGTILLRFEPIESALQFSASDFKPSFYKQTIFNSNQDLGTAHCIHIRESSIVRKMKRLLLELYFTLSRGTLSVPKDLLFLKVLQASLISSREGDSSFTTGRESLRYSKLSGFTNSGGSSSSLSEKCFSKCLVNFSLEI